MYRLDIDRTTKQAVILRDGVEFERLPILEAGRRITELRGMEVVTVTAVETGRQRGRRERREATGR